MPVPVIIPVARSFAVRGGDGDRVAQWERHNAEALIPLTCDAAAGGGFEAVESNLQLSRLHLARVAASGHGVARTALLAETLPVRSVAVYASVRGRAVFERDGRRRVIGPGQLLICDADGPFRREFSRGLLELVVKVPHAALEEALGRRPPVLPLVLSSGPYVDALVGLVDRAVRHRRPVPVDEHALLELVAWLVADGHVDAAMGHRVTARAYVEQQLDDPALCATAVGRAAGVSDRTLTRAFAAAGTSLPRYVLGRRLDAAYGILVTPGAPPTAEVAAGLGFASPAYFSQSFRRRFGVAAGTVRRTGHGAQEPAA
ncbi:helix-turn-helix domain-containing protein [Nocardioides sp. YIM 123512]|uniref:Helix-turn-helix domain-containing protein n=1 Tax=Nocardioides flavescens TaxID=2691959 RepID=A0A6L7EPI4_9ACTN|nr:helix-turn-helix domain-containing protein [Nocardioides flavescens]